MFFGLMEAILIRGKNMKKISHILSYFFMLFFISTQSMAADQTLCESNVARILMLEKALAPQNIDAAATLFAKAKKDRNGALQYMLFSDQLKNKYKDQWPSWVSGVSSPWITSYAIKKSTHSKNSSTFKITYQWSTADGRFLPPLIQTIVVAPVPKNKTNSYQKFWITQFIEN